MGYRPRQIRPVKISGVLPVGVDPCPDAVGSVAGQASKVLVDVSSFIKLEVQVIMERHDLSRPSGVSPGHAETLRPVAGGGGAVLLRIHHQ